MRNCCSSAYATLSFSSDKTIPQTNRGKKCHRVISHRTAMSRVAMVLVVAATIIVVATIGYSMTNPGEPSMVESTTSQQTTRSTCAAPPGSAGTITVTVTANQPWPPCYCILVDSNSQGSLYVSTSAKVGDDICVAASLNESQSVAFTITNSTGSVVFSTPGCVGTQAPGGPPSIGVSCMADWNTTKPDSYGNAIEPGTYHLVASDGQGSAAILEGNFTLA